MGSLFSRHKSRVTEQDNAVLQLKQQRDQLKRYSRRINDSIEKDTAAIKDLVARKLQQRALVLLKKKKYQEKLLEQSEHHLTTVEGLINDIEFAQVQVDVLEGLKKGNEALKKLNALMKLDDVERILSDAADAQEYQEQISELISGNLTEVDDALIEAELDKLLAADAHADSSGDPAPKLPSVPSHEVPAVPSAPRATTAASSQHSHHSHHNPSKKPHGSPKALVAAD